MDSRSPCACSWSECLEFTKVIQSLAPPQHVWRGDPVRLTIPSTNEDELKLRTLAFRRALKSKYFNFEKDQQREFNLELHHFPQGLLVWRDVKNVSQFTRLLTRSEVQQVVFLDSSRNRLMENKNSVGYLCRDKLNQGTLSSKRDANTLFIQTPMETKKAVLSEVTSLQKDGGVENARIRMKALYETATLKFDHKLGKREPVTTNQLSSDPPILSASNLSVSPTFSGDSLRSPTEPQAFSPTRSNPPDIDQGRKKSVSFCSVYRSLQSCRESLDFDDWCHLSVPSTVALSLRQCHLVLRNEFQKCGLSDDFFSSSDIVGAVSRLICVYHASFEKVDLHDGKRWFYPCVGVRNEYAGSSQYECKLFSIRPVRWQKRGAILCPTCTAARKAENKSKSRIVPEEERKRMRSYSRMDVDEQEHTYKKLKTKHKNLMLRYNRLRQKLEEESKKFVVSKDNLSVRSVLQSAVKYINENLEYSRSELLKELVRVEFTTEERQGSGVGKQEDIDNCVNHILDTIRNMGLQLAGKDAQCRFSPLVVDTAMGLFLRNRRAYDEIRKSKVAIFPSPRHLRSISKSMRVEEGGDPILYSGLLDEVRQMVADEGGGGEDCPPIMGHLVVDEVKLKNGIAYNASSNEVTGLCESPTDLKTLYEDAFEDSAQHSTSPCTSTQTSTTVDDNEGLIAPNSVTPSVGNPRVGNAALGNPAIAVPNSTEIPQSTDGITSKGRKKSEVTVFANQWRFRSTNGLIHNSDFFFNLGSLDGNEMLRQFMHVLKTYEFVGVTILGIVLDGGGGNTGFLRLLREHANVCGPWPSIECVRITNPIDPTDCFFPWLCGTHGLKAMRNNAHRSQPRKTRCFTRRLPCGDFLRFGWREIAQCFERDEERQKEHKTPPRTDLVKHAVVLDHFTIMNARYAKLPFSERTICEIIAYLAAELSVEIDFAVEYPSQWHKFNAACTKLKAELGRPGIDPDIRSGVCMLEYQIAIFGLYIERFLNVRWRLHAGNLDEEKKNLQDILSYFHEWREEKPQLEKKFGMDKKSESNKCYIADCSYENLLLGVAGFFAYCEHVISIMSKYPGGDKFYVPALHCNQSTLEAFFSRIRQLGKDFTHLYASGVLQQSILNNKMDKKGNTMYPSEHIGDEIEVGESCNTARKTPQRVGEHTRQQLAIGEIALSVLRKRERHGTRRCHVLSVGFQARGSGFGRLMHKPFSKLKLKVNCYQLFAMEDRKFRGYYSLSIGTMHETWFKTFLDPAHKQRVDRLCQNLVGVIFNMVALSKETSYTGDSKRRGKKRQASSFQKSMFNFLRSYSLEKHLLEPPFDAKSSTGGHRVCYVILLDVLKEHFFEVWLPLVVEDVKKAKLKSNPHPPTRPPLEELSTPSIRRRTKLLSCEVKHHVNRCVGWALTRVIRKYEKLQDGDDTDDVSGNTGTLEVLKDMRVFEIDILHDEDYITEYYPLDDALRNKGFLTLVASSYIPSFTALLGFLFQEIELSTLQEESRNKAKDVKKNVIARLVVANSDISYLEDIVSISERRVATKNVDRKQRTSLVLEMVERLMNMRIGSLIREFRSLHLTRRNDVEFRKELAVLSKKEDQMASIPLDVKAP